MLRAPWRGMRARRPTRQNARTDLGPLDVMQWIAGIEADNLYAELAPSAPAFSLEDLPLHYCGLGHLRAIKQAAGRPRDLDDLEHLPAAEP